MPRVVRAAALALLIGWLVAPVSAGASEVSYAGLVVRDGDGALTFAYVGFTEERISGMDLLLRSGLEVVTVSFGGLGQGVCIIEQTGCPAGECRRRLCQGANADDPFWKYFRQGQPGVWTEAQLGANGARVANGDVDGWSWTGTDAKLPALSLAEVATRAGYDGSGFDAGHAPTGAVHRREGDALAGGGGAPAGTYLAGGAALALGAGAVVLLAARRRRAAP